MGSTVFVLVFEFNERLRLISFLFLGGTSVRADIKAINAGVHVVVGMTGRIADMVCISSSCFSVYFSFDLTALDQKRRFKS